MKKAIQYFLACIIKLAFSGRYRIRVEGMENLRADLLTKTGGIVFLSNHPAYFIDTLVTFLALWPKIPFRPVIAENIYRVPVMHALMCALDGIPIPNFVSSGHSQKRKKQDEALDRAIKGLQLKQNILIYPAGKVKNSAYETIGSNATSAYHIVSHCPDANIVLIRVKGLWGSSFSRALCDKEPTTFGLLCSSAKILLKNLLFFAPRRDVVVEFEVAPAIFPWNATRQDFNRRLELWYNSPDGLGKPADATSTSDTPGDTLVLIPPAGETKDKKNVTLPKWEDGRVKFRVDIAPGKTIAEVFLNQCARAGNLNACADERLGIQTYAELKLRSIIIANYIRKLPGKYIGIMLPSSVGANLLILACQLAGKVPLMVNWTVGPRHLASVIEISHVEVVISSSAFLERLDSVDLNGVDDRLLMIDDIVKQLSLIDKLKAWFRAKQGTRAIMKRFGIDKVSPDSQAVLLFTSGTEAQPKGVPLSHTNLLSNLRGCLTAETVFSDDVIFSFLPPFHSFGFTVGGLLGLLSGTRVFFYPNPNDGRCIARNFTRWQATIIFAAPTFLKCMLKFVSDPSQIKTLRLCITGAEKCPVELFQKLEKLNKGINLREGYGITECSPVLTLNPLGAPHKGVGKPLPGINICIVHPETEVLLPTGQAGLILVNGPNIFTGYVNKGISSPFTMVNNANWYKTGDLGYLDEHGYLTISGRIKRFVKMGGEMVSLAAIEDVLMQHILKIYPQANQDEPMLAICAKEIAGEKSKITLFCRFDISADEVNSVLKKAGFSNLVKVSLVKKLDKLPITGAGKIHYNELEEKYMNQA